MNWKTHGKFIVAAATAVAMAAYAVYREVAQDGITPSEWVTVVIGGFAALQVFCAANVTGFQHAKTIFMAIGVVLNLLVSAIVGGLTPDEIFMLVLQFLGVLAVGLAPAVRHVAVPRSVH